MFLFFLPKSIGSGNHFRNGFAYCMGPGRAHMGPYGPLWACFAAKGVGTNTPSAKLPCNSTRGHTALFTAVAAHTPNSNTLGSSNDSTLQPDDDIDDVLATSTLGSQESLNNFEQLAELEDIEQKEKDLESERQRLELEEQQLQRRLEAIGQKKLRRAHSKKVLETKKAKLSFEQGGGPEYWGIRVEQLQVFMEEIRYNLRAYCLCHRYEVDSFRHVCLDPNCRHDHGCAEHRALDPSEDPTSLAIVQPNMHTVVDLFIKPRTRGHSGMRGLALTLNAEHPQKVEKFVSHSWNGRFEDFVDTLSSNLLPKAVVFVCSFALPQNLDVGPILNDLDSTPFAQAHKVASEVWLIVDRSIDVIDRVWVIYEMFLSLQQNKHVSMGLTTEGSDFLRQIMSTVGSLDVRSTRASKDSDKQAITAAIRSKGSEMGVDMEERLNREIKIMLEEKVHQQQHCARRLIRGQTM